MENFIQILIISITQGITEFLPISSSAHLSLISKYFGIQNELLINVYAHMGSLFAVIFFFKEDLINFGKNKKLSYKILLASVPLFIFGYFILKYDLINIFRSMELIGWMTIIFGILLFISDKFNLEHSINEKFSLKKAVLIGFFQVLALIPGVSRSGIVMTGARFLKFKREDAAKISFLLSIPALTGSSIYGVYKMFESGDLVLNFSSFLTISLSFIFSYLTIKYLLIFLKKFNFNIIVGYRLILGLIILAAVYL
tara:strand:- start:134 stop:898 length:765 start_codon:yes stop_codon:yes gene_type:complete